MENLNIKMMIENIAILENVKESNEHKKTASAAIADVAYNATVTADKATLEAFKNLPKEKKDLIKSAFSKGVYVGNAKLDKAIPEEIAKDAVLTIYNKLKKDDKANEAIKSEQRLAIIRENQALQIIFPDKEALSQFLKANAEDSQVYKDAVNQGLAIMAEEERAQTEAMQFITLENSILSLSQENLEKVFVIVSAKLAKPAKTKKVA